MKLRYFRIEELVPQHIYNVRGEKSWQLLDPRALKVLDWLRVNLGSMTINDWKWGGTYSQSGLRTFEFYMQDGFTMKPAAQEKISSSLSQHKYGRAFDCKFKEYTAEQVREWIKDNWHMSGFDWAITLEEGTSWLHFDVRTRKDNDVYTFKP